MKQFTRGEFIKSGLLAIGCMALPDWMYGEETSGTVMTVNGPKPANSLGFVLSHEHVMVDFVGASQVGPHRYNADEVFNTALPHLKKIHTAGCTTLVECTPAYLGRDVKLLKKLSAASALNIITNTGYYGAAGEKYLPPHVYTETAAQLAARWISEYDNGIDGSGIKPGFLKCSTDSAPLSEAVAKTIQAAAITHQATGLPIAVHTGNGKAAFEQLGILDKQGVSANAWIWIHAQNETDRSMHHEAARKGGWISFDGYNPDATEVYLSFLNDMKKAGLLGRVLISHDAGWYHVGEPGGGNFRPFTDIFNHLLPALKSGGLTDQDIKRIFHTNPAMAFSLRKPVNAKRNKNIIS